MDNPTLWRICECMEQQTDIVIVGGGLNGPALALAVAQAGLHVTIIDALPVDARRSGDFDGRSYALALASTRMLQALGLWDAVADHAQPMLDIKVTDGRPGQGASTPALHFDHAEIEEGPMGYMVEDRHIRGPLLDAIDANDAITVINGARVDDHEVTRSGVTVRLDDGREISGRLLVGADGRRSSVGARAGIKRNTWDCGQTALVCAVQHELPHNGVAHQFFMPAGPLAILPLTDNRSSIVWSETHENAKHIQLLDDADYLAVLRPRFGDFLGHLTLAGNRFTYPLNFSLAERFVADRVALIGDAAHGVHPIAGQGFNAGLRDVGALAQVLVEAQRRGEDFASALVLDRYQQWRRFDRTTMSAAMDTFNRLFSNDNALLRAARGVGMSVVNSVPALRRTFIREAAGLSGDLPKLLQGQQI